MNGLQKRATVSTRSRETPASAVVREAHLVLTLLDLTIPASNYQMLSILTLLMLKSGRHEKGAVARERLARGRRRQLWILLLDPLPRGRLLQERVQTPRLRAGPCRAMIRERSRRKRRYAVVSCCCGGIPSRSVVGMLHALERVNPSGCLQRRASFGARGSGRLPRQRRRRE